MNEFTAPLIMMLVIAGVVAHAALFFASRWVRPILIVAVGYMLLSPLSSAQMIPGFETLKYVRVYSTLLIIALGVMAYRRLKIGVVSYALLAALSFYAIAALWGPNLIAGMMYKGLMVLAILSGILIGGTIGTAGELRALARVFTIGAGALGAIFLAAYVASPESISHIGRFYPWGINPNRVGQSCAPLTVVSIYTAFTDPIKRFRLVALAVVGALGFLILLTASRGAIGMAAIGSFIVIFPSLKRPFLVGGVLLVFGIGANLAISSLETVDVERIGNVNLASREEPWSDAMEYIRRSPFYGHGWVQVEQNLGGGTRNFHSIYFQLLVESGIAGFALFAIFVITGVAAWFRHLLNARRFLPESTGAVFFGGGIMASVFAHGVIESGTLMGSTINVLLLGLSAGFADRFASIVWQDSPSPSLDWTSVDHDEDAWPAAGHQAPHHGSVWLPYAEY